MKKDEIKAKIFLESIGFPVDDIIYEPDGNIPPDFLVKPSLAIEVRRLNKHIQLEFNERPEPLEKLKAVLVPKLVKLFNEYSKCHFYNSALVTIDFSRPVSISKELLLLIKKSLDEQLPELQKIDKRKDLKIETNLTLSIWPVHQKYESPYVLGAIIDNDSGGMVVSDVYKNLLLVIKEKEIKLTKVFPKYPEWLLVLVDYIGYELRDHDMKQLNALRFDKTIFKKIILINPEDPTRYKFLKTNN